MASKSATCACCSRPRFFSSRGFGDATCAVPTQLSDLVPPDDDFNVDVDLDSVRPASRSGHVSPRRRIQQHVAIAIDRKAQRSAEIDMREMRRPQPTQPVVVNPLSLALPVIKSGLHTLRVPCNHQIRQQSQGAGYGNHFVAAPSALRRDLAGVDRGLQLMCGVGACSGSRCAMPVLVGSWIPGRWFAARTPGRVTPSRTRWPPFTVAQWKGMRIANVINTIAKDQR